MTDAALQTVAAHTLGCKVNKCDTDALLARLTNVGFSVGEFNQPADVYIINTCTVTHAGDKKSLQMVRRARRSNPAAFIAVCGCMPRGQAGSADKITNAGADFIFDTRKPEDLLEKLSEMLQAPTSIHAKDETITKDTVIHNSSKIAERTRAFIKIQDGCNRYCAYCIVPYVRGPAVSRPVTDILAEAEAHLKQGIQEIVITGIQAASYGYDTNSEKITFPKLIKHIADLGPKRLRLSSIDPWAVDDAFLSIVSDSPTLCAHFHLSLQSGADKTLAAMNRRYTTADYTAVVNKLRSLRPDMALTTDIIVGFPGESDDDFAQSLEFAKKMAFARIHVFEYSLRAGTPAAGFPGQVPGNIKSARGEKMRALAKTLEERFLHAQVGKQLPVLFESNASPQEGTIMWQGHTENYCNVKAQGINLLNTIKQVQITGIEGNALTGNIKP
ncbi:MAG: tRNA (N(6)-L-threonylcarbamoyladenosine(37)-C(2))-methylthiotransferase MtaB [Defluviitaleaceae bacterium]|nr:tRNA (N(6)-L-threonylcarbamoyladenosine(37)-C(2))-methylthiotransferase MtaB [Defluviitaleaceae bacterium]